MPVPKILAVEKREKLTGFVVLTSVWRGKMREGIIMELVADPADRETIAALSTEAVRYFRETKAHVISCVMSDRRFSAVLNKSLFFKAGVGIAILLGNLDRVDPELSFVTDTDRWHLTFGESDAYMLPLRYI